MAKNKKINSDSKAWKEFEDLVVRIEKQLLPSGATIKIRDKIPEIISGQLREVDASIRLKAGSTELLIIIECRNRAHNQDVTWIEQLVSKRASVGADKTIAISSKGFTSNALDYAKRNKIDLRIIKNIDDQTIKNWALEVETYSFTYHPINFYIDVEVSDDQMENAKEDLDNLYLSDPKITLIDKDIYSDFKSGKTINLRSVIEHQLHKVKDEIQNGLDENGEADIKIEIQYPLETVLVNLETGKFHLKGVTFELKVSEFLKQSINPSKTFSYSNEAKEIVKGIEYKIKKSDGVFQILSIQQEIETGKTNFTFSESNI